MSKCAFILNHAECISFYLSEIISKFKYICKTLKTNNKGVIIIMIIMLIIIIIIVIVIINTAIIGASENAQLDIPEVQQSIFERRIAQRRFSPDSQGGGGPEKVAELLKGNLPGEWSLERSIRCGSFSLFEIKAIKV